MQTEVLRHDVEHRRREGDAEDPAEGPDVEAGPAKKKAAREAGVEPCASRAHAHRLALENEHAARKVMTEGGEDDVDESAS